MLIISESSIGVFLLTALSRIYLVITFAYHLFSALAEYQPLLLKPAAQKEMKDWNSSTRCSRLRVAPGCPFLWCYGVFRCSVPLRVILVFKDIIYVIIILYIMTFGYL
jgi:hypothetical protein